MDWIHPFLAELEACGEEVERHARTKEQKLAAELQRYVFDTSRWLTHGRIPSFYKACERRQPERERREKSDYLQYRNEDGMYADFHANRHTFITNLAAAGVHPKLTQSVARHSDINLTMVIYSHVE